MLRTLRRRLAEEGGVGLVEVLTATLVALIVAGTGVVLLQILVRQQPQISDRAAQIQQGRTLVESVVRELRQGEAVEVAGPSTLVIDTFVASGCGTGPAGTSVRCRVTYECSAGTCTRTTEGGESRQLVSGLLGSEIFSYCEADADGVTSCGLPAASDPSYVGVEVAYPGDDGEESVTFADGADLRNDRPEPVGEELEG